jgi:tRNA(Phe) wybutosine-synthesizing methylase Tyw3
MSRARKGIVWFFAQPPIIHVVVDELKNAQKLVRMGIASGFKNSVLKSIEKKIVVELASTERFDIPLGRDGKFFCGDAYLSLLCDIGNELLKRSKMKIKKLEEAFARI